MMSQADRQCYEQMLYDFGKSLEETSFDDANRMYMTKSQSIVVGFDKFKERKYFQLMSCDAFCIVGENEEWFIIEFKNGNRCKKSDLRLKIFDSLSMLMLHFGKDMPFMQSRAHVILVYNEGKHARKGIAQAMSSLAKSPALLFLPDFFEKLYCKSASEYTKTEFEVQFLNKHGL